MLHPAVRVCPGRVIRQHIVRPVYHARTLWLLADDVQRMLRCQCAGNCLLGGIICQVPPSGAGTLSRKSGHAGRFHPPAGSDGFLVQLLDLRNIVALPVGDAGADIHIVQHLSHERRTPTCRNGIRGIGCVRLCFWRHCFSVGGYRRHHAFYGRHVRHRLIGRLSMCPHLPEQTDKTQGCCSMRQVMPKRIVLDDKSI